MIDPPAMRIAIFYLLLMGSCGYAIWRGGAPERITGWLLIAAAMLTLVVGHPAQYSRLELGMFLIDLALLIALVVIALKADRLWPMVLAALHLDSTAVHILKLFDTELIRVTYAVMIVMWSYPMLLILAIGTLRHQRRLARFGEDRAWSLAMDRFAGETADVTRYDTVTHPGDGPWGSRGGDRGTRGQRD
ncbi:MAG: hypothetical protein WC804_06175 [Sphingomonas sp.]|jgi:hypothetical protein|uniref:hypothetical protein n=1 Tax=Sphingomonas sp. TaxID=28214 RepID=UPI00356260E0